MSKSNVHEQAALLVSEDELSDAEIAQRCGINRRTLTRWKKRPKFLALTDEHGRHWKQDCESQGIAKRQPRIAVLQEIWQALQHRVEIRAAIPEMQSVPGGKTGLLLRRRTVLRRSGHVEVMVDYRLDAKLLRTLRKIEVFAATVLWQYPPLDQSARGEGIPETARSTRPWSGKQERASLLAAQDELPDTEIARQCAITRRTLTRWRGQAEFQRRTAEHRKLCQRACEALFGIADKEKRLDALNDRWQKLQQFMNERAASPEMQNVVGGNTGIVYIRRRVVNSHGHVLVVEQVDQALMREFREHEKQASKELGQWGRPPSEGEFGDILGHTGTEGGAED